MLIIVFINNIVFTTHSAWYIHVLFWLLKYKLWIIVKKRYQIAVDAYHSGKCYKYYVYKYTLNVS